MVAVVVMAVETVFEETVVGVEQSGRRVRSRRVGRLNSVTFFPLKL